MAAVVCAARGGAGLAGRGGGCDGLGRGREGFRLGLGLALDFGLGRGLV